MIFMADDNKGNNNNRNADDVINDMFEELGLSSFMKKYDTLFGIEEEKPAAEKTVSIPEKEDDNFTPRVDTNKSDKGVTEEKEDISDFFESFDKVRDDTMTVKEEPVQLSFTDSVKSHVDSYFDDSVYPDKKNDWFNSKNEPDEEPEVKRYGTYSPEEESMANEAEKYSSFKQDDLPVEDDEADVPADNSDNVIFSNFDGAPANDDGKFKIVYDDDMLSNFDQIAPTAPVIKNNSGNAGDLFDFDSPSQPAAQKKSSVESTSAYAKYGTSNGSEFDLNNFSVVGGDNFGAAPKDDLFDFDTAGNDRDFASAKPVYTKPSPAKKGGIKGWATNNFIPVKGDPAGEVIRKIIFLVSIITIIVCLCHLSNKYIIEPRMAEKSISDMADKNNQSTDLSPEEIKSQNTDIQYPDGLLDSAVKWYTQNQDYAGWIKIDNLGIDYAVAQANDNNYYIRRNFNKEKSRYGCPFVHCDNSIKDLDTNTVIFGHNMENDDLVFGKLEQYMTADGYKKAPIIEYNTPYGNHKWKVFAVFVSNSEVDDDNGYTFNYIFTRLSSASNYKAYLDQLDQRTLYFTGVDVNAGDKLLTLSTCSYEFDGARLVVVARLLRDGESENVDLSNVTEKDISEIRYPQKWYDVNDMENPYKNAEKWYPDN